MSDYTEDPQKSSPKSNPPDKPTKETSKETSLHLVTEEIDLTAEAFSRCKTLAESKNIIVEFLKEIKRLGLVGEKRNAAILYLAMVSRLLNKPVSITVKGQSSTGKSNLVDMVLSFFPSSAYYSSTAISETGLIHDQEGLEHKILVVHELAGMGDKDSKALYFLRELISRGEIIYRVAQEQAKGGHVTVKKERKGPVAVITTTTLVNLFVDLETRFFSIAVDDSVRANIDVCTLDDEDDTQQPGVIWKELQNWLSLIVTANGPYKVKVPYRKALAELLPVYAYRMARIRRDFKNFISLIKAHAILHQASREVKNGYIQTNFDDYETVRTVLGQSFSQGLGLYVPEHIRRVVNTVSMLCPNDIQWATVLDISRHLNLDPSTVRRHIRVAMKDNYLREVQEFRAGLDNRKLKVTIGEPLPNVVEVLPTRQVLENYFNHKYSLLE